MIKVLKEIKRLGEKSVLTNKLDTIFSRITGLHQIIYESETLEREVTKWHQRFAHVITRKFLFLHNQNVMSFFGQQGPRRRAGRTTPDDNRVVMCFERNHNPLFKVIFFQSQAIAGSKRRKNFNNLSNDFPI